MTTSVLKMQRELVAVTEERDRLAAELQKLREQKPVAWLIPQSAIVTFDEDWAHENPDYCDPLFLAPMAAPAVPAPSVPDVLIRLRDKVTKIPHRKEYLGGQQFAYVRICEVIGEIDALLQSAEGRCSQTHNEARHD